MSGSGRSKPMSGRSWWPAAETEIARAIKAHGGDAIVTESAPCLGHRTGSAAALTLRDPRGALPFRRQSPGRSADHRRLSTCSAASAASSMRASISRPSPPRSPMQPMSPIRNIVKAIAPLSDEREVAFARDFLRRPAADLGPRFWHHIGIYAFRRECARALRHASGRASARPSAGSSRCAPSTTA